MKKMTLFFLSLLLVITVLLSMSMKKNGDVKEVEKRALVDAYVWVEAGMPISLCPSAITNSKCIMGGDLPIR